MRLSSSSPTLRTAFAVTVILLGLFANALGRFALLSRVDRAERADDRELAALYFQLGDTFFPALGYLVIALGLAFLLKPVLSSLIHTPRRPATGPLINELERAISRLEAEPEKAKPAWDLARVRLELYFDRNLRQVNQIFWLSVSVMGVGFIFILVGISYLFLPTTDTRTANGGIDAAVLSGIAGVITEFIGATFLFIYRSTVQQAAGYTQTLERINSVGMAMQILDTISNEARELRDRTKADIVRLLLSQAAELSRSVPADKDSNVG
jgi:hypothetical protein